MGKSVVDVQIEGVLAKITLKLRNILKLRYIIQIQNENRSP